MGYFLLTLNVNQRHELLYNPRVVAIHNPEILGSHQWQPMDCWVKKKSPPVRLRGTKGGREVMAVTCLLSVDLIL